MSQKHREILNQVFEISESLVNAGGGVPVTIPELDKKWTDNFKTIAENVHDHLAASNVLITSLLEKIVNPSRDIRLHQSKMEGGYSGRSLDTAVVAPYLKEKGVKTMKESGWLTRSFEQDAPYDLNYKGAIRNLEVKRAFLELLDGVQKGQYNPQSGLAYFLQFLIVERNNSHVQIFTLQNKDKLLIADIIMLLEAFFSNAAGPGASKLPVIALYSVYEVLGTQLTRFADKRLLPLGSHTSADLRSKAVGDIQLNNSNGTPFEGVEVKFGKPITRYMLLDAYEKFKGYPLERYYILSTAGIAANEQEPITTVIKNVETQHGCQIIVNGVISSIKYYLRLLSNPSDFVETFSKNISSDPELKKEFKIMWRDILLEFDQDN